MRGLPRVVKNALEKARESALLAVEVYNKPAVTFKSGGYIILMVVAWTSLFHAIFFRRKRKPYYRKENRRYQRVDGEYRHWELAECLKQYYGANTNDPVRKNLEFFIPLRNRIEHRSLPELDPSIFGECQSMLLNFDQMLEKEFGSKCRIAQCLSFALQMYPSAQNLGEAVRRNRDAKTTAEFIEQYRSSISADVLQSGQYSFKAFLIQVSNHQSQDALPIQFFQYDSLPEEQKKQIEALAVMVRTKQPTIANADTLRTMDVVKRVREALGDPKITRGKKDVPKFNFDWHVRCWRKYGVRPQGGSTSPEITNPKYCIYDRRHRDYGYTEAWVSLLIKDFQKAGAYEELYPEGGGA